MYKGYYYYKCTLYVSFKSELNQHKLSIIVKYLIYLFTQLFPVYTIT